MAMWSAAKIARKAESKRIQRVAKMVSHALRTTRQKSILFPAVAAALGRKWYPSMSMVSTPPDGE